MADQAVLKYLSIDTTFDPCYLSLDSTFKVEPQFNTITHGLWADQPTDFIMPKTGN